MALGIVEVSRNRNYRFGDLFPEVRLGGLLQLSENHGRDFGRRLLLAIHLHSGVLVLAPDNFVRNQPRLFADFVVAPPHEAFDGVNRVARIRHRLPLGGIAHETLTRLGERNHGRRDTPAFRVFQNERLPAFHHGHTGVRRSQINS